ncbi:uncharacterized protein LOC100121756 isoform X1 [Nasonia vitripennis]|uniref:Nicotinamide/nicotinic acid mononucleotide adenylyltransferase 1 n=2 Tax=Nasonia vitripennis TaxID=7425 RepID=A0A7M7HBK0_NASVI|nr:uncharacterized protein LOC100121756 isoform X1 [Nasonia vitripennis]
METIYETADAEAAQAGKKEKIVTINNQMPTKDVLLLSCGKYNPPTNMHLRRLERARDHLRSLGMTVIGGTISPINNYSSDDPCLEDSSVRVKLLELAMEYTQWMTISKWAVKQNTAKSILETLRFHQTVLNYIAAKDNDNIYNPKLIKRWVPAAYLMAGLSPRVPRVQIKLVCGMDVLESITTPGHYTDEEIAEIFTHYGLVIIDEDGQNINRFIYNSDILSKYIRYINVVTEWIPNEVNSTWIRRALHRGESIQWLVNKNVLKSIYENNYYGARKPISNLTTMELTKQEPKHRVILMSCGSYNPPTHMHFRMFERARDHLHSLGTHVVLGGVISPVNDAYAKSELAAGEHREEMLKCALHDSDWIRLSKWELRQKAWTRTRQSLQHHQTLLDEVVQGQAAANSNVDEEDLTWIPDVLRNGDTGDPSPVRIKLLCGGDLLESFATPGLWAEEDIEEIVGRYGLIVITRVGSNPYKFIYDSDILAKHLHNIHIVTEWIPNEVSSTRIRRALKRGESVKYLLHDSVLEYIYTYKIYNSKNPDHYQHTKLEYSSIHSSTDYLDVDEAKSQADDAFLTRSPSDVPMRDTSPCEPTTTTRTTAEATNDEDGSLPETVLQKNLQNSSYNSDDSASTTELAREKFFRSIVNDSLHLTGGESSSSSLLPLQSPRVHSPVELPGSARARNELLAFEDTTESELATLCDNTYSNDREEDALSITYDESSEDAIETSVRNNGLGNGSDDTMPKGAEESLGYDCPDSDSQATKFEIDGKYVKSLVSSRKGKKTDDEDSDRSKEEESVEDERLKLELIDSTPESTEEKTVEEKEKVVEDELKKNTKLFEDDISYIKRLRLIINDGKPINQRQQLQGSLDSINLNETNVGARNVMESMSKKSKSFESIKRNVVMSLKPGEISYCDDTIASTKLKSDSTSQLVTAQEFDAPTEEFCSACCFEQPSSADVFYTIRSNCSSPEDEDSTECDICSSCNLRDDSNDCNNAAMTHAQSLSETAEICEICGEPATSADEPLTSDPKSSVINSRPMPLSLPKAKSTIEISKGSYGRSTLEDDRFEIDNCGLQDCRLRASLDTCSQPEPLYVNITPRHRQPPLLPRHQPMSEAESYRYAGAPKDEVAMSRSLSIGGRDKRVSRKGSYAKTRNAADRAAQEKRRFSSVDNLQNRMSFRSSGEKFSKSRDNKFMTSADSIRPRVARSRSLRRSADNVGRFDSSGDNLDSLEENADTDDNGVTTSSAVRTVKIRDSDTIKMILTKHGIKIISQKETVL